MTTRRSLVPVRGPARLIGRVAVIGLSLVLLAAPSSGQVVVEEVLEGEVADRAGLRPGDVLLSWRRPATEKVHEPASGNFSSPLDVSLVEVEQSDITPVAVDLRRDGRDLRADLGTGVWLLRTRPVLDDDELHLYTTGREAAQNDDAETAAGSWEELLTRWGRSGLDDRRVWLLLELARARQQTGDLEEAAGDLQRALRIATPTEFPRQRALVLMELASHHLDHADAPAAAGPLLREALALRSEPDPEGLAVHDTLKTLLFYELQRGRSDRALELLDRSRRILQRVAAPTAEMASVHHNIGYIQWQTGDLLAAEANFLAAQRLDEELNLGPTYRSSRQLMLGHVAASRGDLDTAKEHLRAVVDLRQLASDDPTQLAGAWANYGSILQAAGDLEEAEEALQKAARMRETLRPKSSALASTYRALASVHHRQGQHGKAMGLLQRAYEMMMALEPRATETGNVANWMGRTHLRLGQRAEARNRLVEALEIYRDTLPHSDRRARVAFELASLMDDDGDTARAMDLCHEAIVALDRHRSKLGGSLQQQATYGARFADHYATCVEIALKSEGAQAGFALHERGRARILRAFLADRDLDHWPGLEGPDAERLATARRDYAAAIDRLRALGGSEQGAEREHQRHEVEDAYRRLNTEIARARSAHRRQAALQEPVSLTAEEVSDRLEPGTLALSFSVGSGQLVVFSFGPDSGELTVRRADISAALLHDAVAELERLLTRPSPLSLGRLERASAELGTLLLDGLEERLARARRLLVVPDGDLYRVPFAVLQAPGDERALVERLPVSLAPSLSLALELTAATRRTEGRLALFADPDLPGDPASVDRLRSILDLGSPLGRLPASRTEARRIAELAPDASALYLGSDATESETLRAGREARVLHFATHAFSDSRSPMESALLLTPEPGAAPGAGNGLLQAWEVVQFLRTEAQVVTLSACDTGRGQGLANEGLLGLVTAFLHAGAQNVVASLWRVSDESTALLMERFYQELLAGAPVDGALRRAQLALLRGEGGPGEPLYSHPFHWAPFQVIGSAQAPSSKTLAADGGH